VPYMLQLREGLIGLSASGGHARRQPKPPRNFQASVRNRPFAQEGLQTGLLRSCFDYGARIVFMRFKPLMGTLPRRLNFLDATEDEVIDLVRSLVCELSIMTCFLTLPPEKKRALQTSIASFRTFLGESRHKQ
jgi:hypothetical protein